MVDVHGILVFSTKSNNSFDAWEHPCPTYSIGLSLLLITSAIHMKRSQLCFKKAGIKTIPFTVDNRMSYRSQNIERIILPSAKTLERWEELIHEIIGYYVYKISW